MTTAVGAALLAIDNLLGFFGTHLITAGVVPALRAVVVTAGVAAIGGAAVTRQATAIIVAVAVVGFVTVLSPSASSTSWAPVETALRAIVPIVFAAAGMSVIRDRRASAALRSLAALLTGSAVAWAVTAFIPVPLTAFLVVQAATLGVAATLSLHPVLRRVLRLARQLWSSADVR